RRSASFGEAILDIGAQRVQRQTALQIPLGARDFVAVQSSADADFDAFAAEAQRRVHCLAHGAAEAHALFQLQRNRFRDQLRVQLRLMHFLDIYKNILAGGALLQFGLELVNFRALAANDDPWPRGLDDDAQLVSRPLDLNRADARRLQLVLELGLQLNVFVQLFVIVPLGKPARLPRLGEAEAKTIWMDFLSHCFS